MVLFLSVDKSLQNA